MKNKRRKIKDIFTDLVVAVLTLMFLCLSFILLTIGYIFWDLSYMWFVISLASIFVIGLVLCVRGISKFLSKI
jgi:uncharacterized membrane protein YqjE